MWERVCVCVCACVCFLSLSRDSNWIQGKIPAVLECRRSEAANKSNVSQTSPVRLSELSDAPWNWLRLQMWRPEYYCHIKAVISVWLTGWLMETSPERRDPIAAVNHEYVFQCWRKTTGIMMSSNPSGKFIFISREVIIRSDALKTLWLERDYYN